MEKFLKTEKSYQVIFNHIAKVTEEVTIDSLQGLCQHIWQAQETYGTPVKVITPQGDEYYWGEKGMYLAHQLIDGAIDEQKFLELFEDANKETANMVKKELEQLENILKEQKKEIHQSEHKTQELLDMYLNTFEMIMKQKKLLIKLENNHE
jgi:predicted ribosome quality control (RQC) complex YloA/Tae2 family protein